jgi:hypothetical protein
VKSVDDTLPRLFSMQYLARAHDGELHDAPLHPLRMIHFRTRPLPLLPYPHGAVPAAAHKFGAGRAPVARHDGCNVCFIDLPRGCQISNVEGIEVVVF